jgi:hypothetical protein
MNISTYYGSFGPEWPRIYCVSYYKDAWDTGLTHSFREWWF